ncbi:hypothetical protein G7059_01600 [Erysipelothrix sp. HDW6A]|uniref:hypothetical protein n=1 Tax=Erysipelothrix sp. HDW6A TaxID=2714928 RepID=UPI0014090907|nr:hypothetical protein [Erysipelothrix sp. HDW6A]QIK56630.1 hypothetical protein G7059_01600 [Erysipelothrix sp. HDW6A]
MKWLEKYEVLVNNEELNTEHLKLFVGKVHRVARQYRIDLVAELEQKGIKLANPMLIPTELFLEHIGKDMNYFETKMKQEAKIAKYRKEREETK